MKEQPQTAGSSHARELLSVRLYTIAEAARLLELEPRKIRRWAQRRTISSSVFHLEY